MNVAAQLVEGEPRVLLGLKALVLVGVGLDAGREEGDDPAEDDPEDRHHRDHLDQRITRLARELLGHFDFDLASTSASACRATAALRAPIPQRAHARRSATISVRNASAPCDQPSSAPVTTHAC